LNTALSMSPTPNDFQLLPSGTLPWGGGINGAVPAQVGEQANIPPGAAAPVGGQHPRARRRSYCVSSPAPGQPATAARTCCRAGGGSRARPAGSALLVQAQGSQLATAAAKPGSHLVAFRREAARPGVSEPRAARGATPGSTEGQQVRQEALAVGRSADQPTPS
jgi:hypothetical protein